MMIDARVVRLSTIALPLVACLLAMPAFAELVGVRLSSADSGQGWLFGPPSDGHCWLATPAHVLRRADGALERGIVGFRDGTEAQISDEPVQPVPAIDLAFARVPSAGPCFSRLGLPEATRLIEAAEDVQLKAMSGGNVKGFVVTTVEHDARRGYVTVRSRSEGDRLMKGFSGAVLEDTQSGIGLSNVPLAMLLSVCTPNDVVDPFAESDAPTCDGASRYGIALRFDRIRSVFDTHVGSRPVAGPPSGGGVVAGGGGAKTVRLLGTRGRTVDAASGPGNAIDAPDLGACWSATTDPKRRIALRIAPNAPISRISVRACAYDATGLPDGVQIKRRTTGDRDWSSVRYCRRGAAGVPAIACAFAPFAADEVELEFHRRGGDKMSIGYVEIE